MNTASILVAALGLLLTFPLVDSDVVAREGTIPETVGVPAPSPRLAPEPIDVMMAAYKRWPRRTVPIAGRKTCPPHQRQDLDGNTR